LLATATAEVLVGFWLSGIGKSVKGPTLAVIGVGLIPAVVAVLLAAAKSLTDRRHKFVLSPPTLVLVAATVLLALAGGLWISRDGGVTLRFELTEESHLAPYVTLANRESAHWKQGCIGAGGFPSLPSLGRLEEVCAYTSRTDPQVEFDGRGYFEGSGVAYIWSPQTSRVASDECVMHLGGPWWAVTNGVDAQQCPFGYVGVGGG
jgi:hypothetical protein